MLSIFSFQHSFFLLNEIKMTHTILCEIYFKYVTPTLFLYDKRMRVRKYFKNRMFLTQTKIGCMYFIYIFFTQIKHIKFCCLSLKIKLEPHIFSFKLFQRSLTHQSNYEDQMNEYMSVSLSLGWIIKY